MIDRNHESNWADHGPVLIDDHSVAHSVVAFRRTLMAAKSSTIAEPIFQIGANAPHIVSYAGASVEAGQTMAIQSHSVLNTASYPPMTPLWALASSDEDPTPEVARKVECFDECALDKNGDPPSGTSGTWEYETTFHPVSQRAEQAVADQHEVDQIYNWHGGKGGKTQVEIDKDEKRDSAVSPGDARSDWTGADDRPMAEKNLWSGWFPDPSLDKEETKKKWQELKKEAEDSARKKGKENLKESGDPCPTDCPCKPDSAEISFDIELKKTGKKWKVKIVVKCTEHWICKIILPHAGKPGIK